MNECSFFIYIIIIYLFIFDASEVCYDDELIEMGQVNSLVK